MLYKVFGVSFACIACLMDGRRRNKEGEWANLSFLLIWSQLTDIALTIRRRTQKKQNQIFFITTDTTQSESIYLVNKCFGDQKTHKVLKVLSGNNVTNFKSEENLNTKY